ncbi:MAG: DUF1488 domain-containing protein [Gammaproteobacteria bacterium]|nr:DUF1488 domain-containing protein [Gammaproteobacteria bacterium]
MKLSFPNPSRSFDEAHNRVLFWGYDRAMEVSFSVDCAVLPTLCPEMGPAGVGTLKAFDQVRERIHEVAKQVYARTGKGQANAAYAYVLNAVDF